MTREQMIEQLLENILILNLGRSAEEINELQKDELKRLNEKTDLEIQNMLVINCL
jgi:hypothetical protein